MLAEPASPPYVRWALDQANHPDPFYVAVFAPICVTAERATAHQIMAPWLAERLENPVPGIEVLPFYRDLVARYRDRGTEGVATMPDDWWAEVGPIGTLDDAATHLAVLEAAGAHSIGLFPAPDIEIARSQLDDVLALAHR